MCRQVIQESAEKFIDFFQPFSLSLFVDKKNRFFLLAFSFDSQFRREGQHKNVQVVFGDFSHKF